MGIIYKANFPNGKCYIGQTKNELNTRIIQYKSDSKYNTTNIPFYNEYKKYSKWTKKQILEIANLYLQGKKIDEIANIVSFSIDRKDIVEITGGRKFQFITNLPRTHRRKNI